jgi:predicted small metal-binding protein
MVSFTCRDLGIDCSYETYGVTNSEIMKKCSDHFASAHNMQVLTADVIFRVKNVIKKE